MTGPRAAITSYNQGQGSQGAGNRRGESEKA